MLNFFFFFLNFLHQYIISPIILPFSYIFPFLIRRRDFEQKNFRDEKLLKREVTSKNIKVKADYCFEVSSEGELEQVLPLIKYYLSEDKYVELLYCSPSVEEKMIYLNNKFSNLYTYRVPLLTYGQRLFNNPSRWVSADVIFFCRYDFFPMLIWPFRNKRLILLNASLKGKKLNIFRAIFYNIFEKIVASNPIEMENFKALGISNTKLKTYDFRIEQIINRQNLGKQNEFVSSIKLWTKSVDTSLVMASAWPEDLFLLDDPVIKSKIVDGSLGVFIFPHDLSSSHVIQIKKSLELSGFVVRIVENKEGFHHQNQKNHQDKPLVNIVIKRGVLCESFPCFSHAYVGGGFKVSIHSVLEPFVGGCLVSYGPINHRSSELDFIKSVGENSYKQVNNNHDFVEFLQIKGENRNILSYFNKEEVPNLIKWLDNE